MDNKRRKQVDLWRGRTDVFTKTHFDGTYSGSFQAAVWLKAKTKFSWYIYNSLAALWGETNCGPAAKMYRMFRCMLRVILAFCALFAKMRATFRRKSWWLLPRLGLEPGRSSRSSNTSPKKRRCYLKPQGPRSVQRCGSFPYYRQKKCVSKPTRRIQE